MEVASLAIALPGLIVDCLDLLERAESARDFDTESFQAVALSNASRTSLKTWAEEVGFLDDKLANEHHPRLDDAGICNVVSQNIRSIHSICNSLDLTQSRLGFTNSGLGGCSPLEASRPQQSSFRARMKWGLRIGKRFRDQVESLQNHVDRLYQLIPLSRESKSTRDELRTKDLQERIRIDDWLGILRIDQQLDRHLSYRLTGTCESIISHPAYLKWQAVDHSHKTAKLLWLCGPAGFGKTVLCASLVQRYKEDTSRPLVAYLFCSAHVQTGSQPDATIRTWISQLIRQNVIARDVVFEHLRNQDTGPVASVSDIWNLLKSIISVVPDCILVLDGVDEYEKSGHNRTEFLQNIKTATRDTAARVVIASRDESDLRAELTATEAQPSNLSILECVVSNTEVQADVALLSESIVDKRLQSRHQEDTRKELAAQMALKSEGMFLWVKMQQDQLQAWRSKTALQKIVNDMPGGLHHTYERNWKSVLHLAEEQDFNRAMAILRWAAFAFRPLTVSELTEALLIEPDQEQGVLCLEDMPDDIDDEYIDGGIKDLCGSLIDVRSSSSDTHPGARTVHLVHPSVRTFLLSVQSQQNATTRVSTLSNLCEQHGILAKICLRYLNCNEVWKSRARPFLEYAVRVWSGHINASGHEAAKLKGLVSRLFQHGNDNFNHWSEMFESAPTPRSDEEDSAPFKPSTPLYYATLFNLIPALEELVLQNKDLVNYEGGRYGSALQAACATGHMEAFALLLEWGADVNMEGGKHGSALNAAALFGREEMARRLVNLGARISADSYGNTPLLCATLSGNSEMVSFFLQLGADATIRDHAKSRTPIFAAAVAGHTAVLKLLVESAAPGTINLPACDGLTPLNAATLAGILESVEILLINGADHTIHDEYGLGPLHTAAVYGRLKIAEVLLDHHANILAVANDGLQPLFLASLNGHLEVAELLLNRGADVLARNEEGWAPLYAAVFCGHEALATLLLERGADHSTANSHGTTPLLMAIDLELFEMTKLLLDHGADIEYPRSPSPLQRATHWANLKIVNLLLANGAVLEKKNNSGMTPLYLASEEGHDNMIGFLLARGANQKTRSNKGFTPLHAAVAAGHTESVKLLLDHGVGVDDQENSCRQTPRCIAAVEGHVEIAEQLMQKGANPSSYDDHNWTPLHAAAFYGHLDIVRLLVSQGANFEDQRNVLQSTLLHTAIRKNRVAIAEYLLGIGADATCKDIFESIPLFYAAQNGSSEAVELLLGASGNIDDLRGSMWGPLTVAIWNNNTDIIKRLVQISRPGLLDPDREGRTALHLAAPVGVVETLEYLLEAGFDPTARDHRQRTVLEYAAASGACAMVERVLRLPCAAEFLEHGPNWTPLHWAARVGDRAMILILKQAGVQETTVRTSKPAASWTPWAVATFFQNSKVLLGDCPLEQHGIEQEFPPARKHVDIMCDSCEIVSGFTSLFVS